jgi:3-oxoacyl-[acyl-carrier-protein] synthase II
MSVAGIKGLGAVTGYGWGMDRLWSGLASGEPAGKLQHGLGGRFPDPCWFARVPDGGDPSIGHTRYSRAFVSAAEEAIADAKRRGWTPGSRVGIVHATTRADLEMMRARYLNSDSISPRRAYVEQSWTTPSALVMMKHQFRGPVIVASAACSSGLHTLAVAQRLLACQDATDMIVVAADVGFDGEEIRHFASLGPLFYDRPPQDVCRPFQEGTSGFVLGEGVAALVLSSKGTGKTYAHLLSSVLGNDAYHPVSIEPSFREIVRTVELAMNQAEVQGADVSYYSAHATGTIECRGADAAALDSIGTRAVAYGFKPLLGHCMGAAPLLDTIILAKAYDQRFLPAPRPVASGHAQLAPGPIDHRGGITVQLGLGFGGNISAAVYASPYDGSIAPESLPQQNGHARP